MLTNINSCYDAKSQSSILNSLASLRLCVERKLQIVNCRMKKPLSAPDLNREAKLKAFDRLLTIMDELRENCPWDKKQTLESLRHLTIEETYELSDSILDGNLNEVKKELGDLMLHNVFYARIASEMKTFDISDVLNSICDKLIERHPHVYSDVVANDEKTVKENCNRARCSDFGRDGEQPGEQYLARIGIECCGPWIINNANC